jgi:hypothetical protein
LAEKPSHVDRKAFAVDQARGDCSGFGRLIGQAPAANQPAGGGSSIEQSVSERTRLSTPAFSGLASLRCRSLRLLPGFREQLLPERHHSKFPCPRITIVQVQIRALHFENAERIQELLLASAREIRPSQFRENDVLG